MQTNPAVWGADAREFRPERWITPGGVPAPKDLPHGWSGLVAFCDGPRMCIGYRLGALPLALILSDLYTLTTLLICAAVLELKVMLATLVRSIEFGETGARIEQRISPTLQPVVDGQGGVLPLKLSLASHH